MRTCSACNNECPSNKHSLCPKCKEKRIRARSVVSVTRHRRDLKQKAIEYKGGRCAICSYDKFNGALDFHHLDPKEKDFALSGSGITKSWAKVKEELDKCILLCANCHREVHGGLHWLVSSMVERGAVNSRT